MDEAKPSSSLSPSHTGRGFLQWHQLRSKQLTSSPFVQGEFSVPNSAKLGEAWGEIWVLSRWSMFHADKRFSIREPAVVFGRFSFLTVDACSKTQATRLVM